MHASVGHAFEDCSHFFIDCPFYNESRVNLLKKKKKLDKKEMILAGDKNLTPQ